MAPDRPRFLLRRRRGFSLLEVMVSSAILMGGIAALLTAWNTIRGTYQQQRNLARATNLSAAAIDQLAIAYQGSPLLAPNSSNVIFTADHNGKTKSINPYFVTTCTVVPDIPIPGMKNIVCNTAWNDGRPHNVAVRLYRE